MKPLLGLWPHHLTAVGQRCRGERGGDQRIVFLHEAVGVPPAPVRELPLNATTLAAAAKGSGNRRRPRINNSRMILLSPRTAAKALPSFIQLSLTQKSVEATRAHKKETARLDSLPIAAAQRSDKLKCACDGLAHTHTGDGLRRENQLFTELLIPGHRLGFVVWARLAPSQRHRRGGQR